MNPALLALNAAPEILMVALGLAVAILDVTLLRERAVEQRARWLGGATAAGLVAVFALLMQHLSVAGDLPIFDDAERTFVVDGLTISLRALVVLVTLGVVLLSIGYDFTRHVGEYMAITVLAAVGMNLLVATENLMMFFVAVELLSVCMYVLTGLHRGVLRSAEAAVKYFMIGALSSAFLLFGLSYVVGTTGVTDLRELAEIVARPNPPLLLYGGLGLVIVGLGFKVAVVPFHTWAPDAYEGAPTPVTAFLATGSKIAGFVITAKILLIGFMPLIGEARIAMAGDLGVHFVPGWALFLAFISVASMVWGNVAATAQRNTKRMLAYSSIAHGGYILIGIIAGTTAGMTSVLYYLVAYALANLGAFGVAAALTRAGGGDNLSNLDGMVQRAPGLSALLLLFVLSLAGVPPLAGFFGKLYVFASAVNADRAGFGLLWLVIVGLATSAISLYYYLILLKHVMVHKPKTLEPAVTPLATRLTLTVLGVATVAIGAFPQPLVDFIERLVEHRFFHP